MYPEPKVYVVEDDVFTRSLLEEILGAADLTVETYSSAEEFLAAYSPDNSGCLLLDMLMPGMNGLELQKQLKARGNITPIIFLSGSDQISTAVNALKGGAVDFLEKPFEPQEVIASVHRALVQDQKARYERLQQAEIENRAAQLTAREVEVMEWMVRGKSSKQIAGILDISARTVEVHRRNVLSKMQAESLASLVQAAVKLQGT